MVDQQPSRILFALLVVIVLVVAGVGVALLYEFNQPKGGSPAPTVQVGDNVTVNYIGEFGSGAQLGRVFDTSFYSVAIANGTYPKSLEFTMRPSPSSYSPLGVHVGANTPSSGYSVNGVNFGGVVTGFWQGLVGLPVNHSKTIAVPPNLGYGGLNQSCLTTGNLVFTVPVYSNVPADQFSTRYPNVTASVGVVFPDPTYGWNDSILSVNASTIVVQALTSVGYVSEPDGLPYLVSSLSPSVVTLSSQLTTADAGLVLGHVKSGGLCSSVNPKGQFIVSAVDTTTGTYTANFNPEVYGETLDFVVTVVQIYPS